MNGAGPQAGAAAVAGEAPESGAMALALVLAGLAGWVDALGFVRWHGLFVSFMSGNTTHTAVAMGTDWASFARFGGTIVVFVAGVLVGELLGPLCGRFGRPAVLAAEAASLWAGLASSLGGFGEPWTTSVLGFAMGLQNASVHHADGISVSLTYVTGTLVKIGRGLAEALRGVKPVSGVLPYLGLWLAVFVGSVLGAAVARASAADAIAIAAAAASALAILSGATARRYAPAR